jgi:hypothetical protein
MGLRGLQVQLGHKERLVPMVLRVPLGLMELRVRLDLRVLQALLVPPVLPVLRAPRVPRARAWTSSRSRLACRSTRLLLRIASRPPWLSRAGLPPSRGHC